MSGASVDSSQVKSLTDLMIMVIQSPSTGLKTVELAGELIAESARFNQWAHERKSRSTADEMWNISALLNHCHSDCLSAWQNLVASTEREASLEALLAMLMAALDSLKRARESDHIEFVDPSMPPELREWL